MVRSGHHLTLLMRSQRARHHGGGRQESSTRKYNDSDGYSAYDSDRGTPFSEYESRTNGKRTVYSDEYTTDADYSDGDRSSYSEYDGKRTPYSEYITEYTDETDDDRMSGTLGIARNQYCTTLNGLVEGSESSSESSYSQSTFASDFDRMCNANVNTNCMATLFNRNTDVPGTIHCGHGEHSETQQKMSLPIPLHYMDHLVPSKQELNSALDSFAQKFDTGDEERPGFPQVYKSLFEANLSQTASNEDEERVVDCAPRRKTSDRNRSQELAFTKAKREALSKVEKDKDPDILSPPSHIIIKDDFTAISSAESFGFAPETQKLALNGKLKKDRREGSKRHSSPRHSSPRNITVPHRQTTSHHPSPLHSSAERPSPRLSSSRRATEKSKREYTNAKPDAPVATRHGLDRLMHKQATSPSKRLDTREEESPVFKGETGLKSPHSAGRVILPTSGKKPDAISFPHADEARQDADPSKLRQLSALRAVPTSRTNTASQLRSESYRHGLIEEESPSLDERLVPVKSSIDKVSSSRIRKQFVVSSEAPHPAGKKLSLVNHGYNDMAGAADTNEHLWRNSANSIPYVLSLKPTRTAVSELTGEGGYFGENKRDSAPLETIVGSARGNATVNVQVLTLKPTQTAVSELTGEAGDFVESRGFSVPLAAVVANPRDKEPQPKMAHDFGKLLHVENTTKSVQSRLATSEDDNIIMNPQTPSRRNGELTNGLKASKPDIATHSESTPAEADSSKYFVAKRSAANKKAETLDRLEDALMGSRKSFSSDQKPRREEGLNKNQVFTFEESRSEARLQIDYSGSTSIGNAERKQEESAVTEAQGEPIEKPTNEFQRKPTRPEMDDTTPNRQAEPCEPIEKPTNEFQLKPTRREIDDAALNRQAEPFETKKVTLQNTEETQEEERDIRSQHAHADEIKGDAMNKALLLHSESFSDCYNGILASQNDTVSEDRNDGRCDKEIEEIGGDDPTSLSALDNEISLLESQITGLEQHDQVSDIRPKPVSKTSNHFGDQLIKSEEALLSTIEITTLSDANNIQPRLPTGPSKSPSLLSESDKETSGDYHHFKPPLVPTQQNDQLSKRGRKNKGSSISKAHTMQNKSTDATLVTAPTVMTMDTPFTMDATLIVSPAPMGGEEKKWDRNSNMLVATAISLPSEKVSSDRTDNNSPFLLVFIVGTKKYFTDVFLIILSWMRHLSSMGFIQRQHGRVEVGLMVPPIADDDVVYEQQLQKRSLGISQFASPSSEEPGIVVESFVPEMWAENEFTGGKTENLFPLLSSNSIWNRLYCKNIEATTHLRTEGKVK